MRPMQYIPGSAQEVPGIASLYPGYGLQPALLRAGAQPASGLAARRARAARSVPLPR